MRKDPLLALPAVSTETQPDLAHNPNNGSIILGLSLQGPPCHQCGDMSPLLLQAHFLYGGGLPWPLRG